MGKITIANGAVVGAAQATVVTLTAGATPAIDATLGSLFTLTPGEDETITVTGGVSGEDLTLRVLTSGATSRTLTFGTGFSTTGTLATGTTTAKVFVVRWVHDGTQFREVSRTAAQ